MKLHLIISFSLAVSTSACVFLVDNECEDVTLAAEQIQACQSLQKQITQAKDQPIIRTELERRYQQDCIDVRYYRDGHQTALCGHDGKVTEASIAPAVKK
jgi:hypothetical protein